MDWICRILEAVLALAPLATALIALFALCHAKNALRVSEKIADKQLGLMAQEWLPYLSYEKMHGRIVKGVMGLCPEFYVELKNNGRCVVQYEIKKFDVVLIVHYCELAPQYEEGGAVQKFIPTLKSHTLKPKSDRKESNSMGTFNINGGATQRCGVYQFLLEEGTTIDVNSATYQFQIDFVVGFGKKGDNENNYSLKYVIDMVYKDDNFSESISWADIEGY